VSVFIFLTVYFLYFLIFLGTGMQMERSRRREHFWRLWFCTAYQGKCCNLIQWRNARGNEMLGNDECEKKYLKADSVDRLL